MSDEGLNDRGIGNLFDTLPKRCIVLLEDIDSSGIDREPAKVEIPDPNDPTKTKTKEKVKVGVTLSGLLNVLDGPASGVGRLVVMTSNCPDSLDAALLRPGRIDSKILFGYADKEVSRSIFTHIFTKAGDERSSPGEQGQESSRSTNVPPEGLQSLADEFAASIPETKISPAEVQGYLMRYRDDPLTAVRDAGAWAQETLEIKAAGANVAFFENEVAFGDRINGVKGVVDRRQQR